MRFSRSSLLAPISCLALFAAAGACRTTAVSQSSAKSDDGTGQAANPIQSPFVTRDGQPVPLPALKPGISRVTQCADSTQILNKECASVDEDAQFRNTTAVSFAFHQAQNPKPPGDLSRRDFHPKQHACVAARFEVLGNLPPTVAKGLFARPGVYPAAMRFSNGSPQVVKPNTPIVMKPDAAPDARGLAIKVSGVQGEPLMADEPAASAGETNVDFLMINFPAFFLRSADNYANILKALATDPNFITKLDPLERSNLIHTQKVIEDIFSERYWSETPARLGQGNAMKFSVTPCGGGNNSIVTSPGHDDENYLRGRAAKRLQAGDVCMMFSVQPQTDPAAMPVEDAAVEWPEALSPFVPVAKLTLVGGQNINDPDRDSFCQDNSFNPWNSIVDHTPMGSINRARLMVYAGISRKRRLENAKPIHEPGRQDPFYSVLKLDSAN